MNLNEMYQKMGIDNDVYTYGQKIAEELKERFAAIDETAEYNQLKVLHAMQKNRVSDIHFAATSGYGYNDLGRDTLEDVYADTFHAEAGLVRPQITCGTHALAVALAANLRPGDELDARHGERDHHGDSGLRDAADARLRQLHRPGHLQLPSPDRSAVGGVSSAE